ncbi:PQQ-dependent sugar dehydrogenase [Actinomadura rubrisoli]|uniref:PKD domain-containing protein n=1 Tax=Actinomadura rubrisoli TaxID=2530368 RepID=A0A4V2YX91_9ACTN|nr:PQQ-dependent sugar dehydrogenase [Actinomadura rubrisoli]TDD88537.1 PKD domain-containing protein [Actinomadura rubrisoli]
MAIRALLGRERKIGSWGGAMLAVVLAVVLVAALEAGGAARAAALPANFQQKTVFSGLTMPTNVEFSPDGRVFVAEKSGIVKVFDSLSDTTPSVFADLRSQTFNGWDRGLLGMALHPNFPTDPRVYVMYTYNGQLGGTYPKWPSADGTNDQCPDPPGANNAGCVVAGRISVLSPAVQARAALAGPVNEQVLVEDWCQQFSSHSIGTLAFGKDGQLYAGGGDGASFQYADYGQKNNACGDPPQPAGTPLTAPTGEGGALRAQDLRTAGDPVTLDGTIIRVNPDTGQGSAGNPLPNGDTNARRVIAHGLRNPYRFTVRPGTNEVWTGDVGYTTWEEINRLTEPFTTVRNFGWPCYEGAGRTPGYDGADLTICEKLYGEGAQAVTQPHFAYKHSDKVVPGETCSVGSSSSSGTSFYAGSIYPAQYRGALFFSDYSRQCVWVMKPGTNGLPDKTKIETFSTTAGGVVELQAGPNGDIFAVDVIGNRIVRFVYNGVNNPPVAALKSDVTSGPAPLTVKFDGGTSSDADGDVPLTYAWDLDGDGAYDDSTAAAPSFTYAAKGRYPVGLKVTDTRGASDTATQVITAGSTPPVATISSPSAGLTWKVGDRISFAGTGTDGEDGTLSGDSLKWQTIMHHCPSDCHTHAITGQNGNSGEFVAPDHEYPSWIEQRLTVTDSDGLSDTKSVELHPKTAEVTLASNPAGIPLTLLETAKAAPFKGTVIAGSTVSISAPTQTQVVGDKAYEFVGWSDGGASAHNITVNANVTLTATYRLKTNLALQRPVKVSSVEKAGVEGPKAVDGNLTTRWSSKRTDPQWIEVDLGAARPVGYVLLRWEAAYGKEYKVQTSTGGGVWTTVHTRTNGNGAVDVIQFVPVSARWVRIYGTKRATTYGYSLFEMEVFDK